MKKNSSDPFVVRKSDFREIRLVDNKGDYHQKISITEARNIASFSNLDLVCFNRPNNKALALCKVIDFGKWKYSEEKRKKKLNKENKRDTKEMRFSPMIGENDVRHKVKQVNGFLENGHEVILSMRLKGRELNYFKKAEEVISQIASTCNGSEISRKRVGKMINIRLGKKKETKS